jgi:hypothetical protein
VRNLLTDVTKIAETSKNCKLKDGSCLKSVANGLVSLGYDAALCKSRWEKSPSCPAGIVYNSLSSVKRQSCKAKPFLRLLA